MADLNSQLFQQLAQFALAPVSTQRRTSDFDIAMAILRNTKGAPDLNPWNDGMAAAAAKSGQKDPRGPGALSRIVDVLLRPLYASANVVKGNVEQLRDGFQPSEDLSSLAGLSGLGVALSAGDAWKGFSGQEKTTTRDIKPVIEDVTGTNLPDKGVAGFATNLAGDILLDPLTFVPVGTALKASVRGGAKLAGKESPHWALPRYMKQQLKTPPVSPDKISPVIWDRNTLNPTAFDFIKARGAVKPTANIPALEHSFGEAVRLPELGTSLLPKTIAGTGKATTPPPTALFQSALNDAPIVSTALEEGTKRAAVAEQALSPQGAALLAEKTAEEAKLVLKAANASPASLRTYDQLMKSITFKSRGPLQNTIDKNASKIAVAITPETQKTFRSQKGQFLKYGTMLPAVSKAGVQMASPSSTIIKPISVVQNAAMDVATQIKPKPNKAPTGPKGIFGPLNTQLSKAINDVSAFPVKTVKPGERLDELSVVQGIMSRFVTYTGQKDLRPLVLDNLSSAKSRAGLRIQALQAAFKGHTDDEILDAWEAARNALPRDMVSDKVSGLADELTGQMENFFRSRAIPEKLAKGNSAALRSGMMMKDINRALRRYKVPFQFTAGKAINPVTHSPVSYEQGTNWLISWESYAPKSAAEVKQFMFGVQSAAEHVLAEYAFIDDVAARFGSRGKTKLHNVRVQHPRLARDFYFEPKMADQLSTALKTMNEMYVPGNKITKFLAKSISMWKSGVTIYHPRHHVANVIGDTFLAWLAGVNDPVVFQKAMKVMMANKGLYKDLASVEELVGRDAVKNAMAKSGTVVAKNKSGAGFTARQIYTAAVNMGLLQKARVAEDIVEEGIPFASKLPKALAQPFGGKVHDFAAKTSEVREHYVKLAHFIDAVQKSKGKNYRQVFENAAHEVRKWHPDGLDLTKEEQFARTLLIPFYSWIRKSTPLLIEGALMRPQKAFTAYPKTANALQTALGIQGTEISDPYPADQLFPSWLRDDMTPVIGKPGSPGLAGMLGELGRQKTDENGNPIDAYTLGLPSNPMQDLFTQFAGFRSFGETKDSLLSSATPWARIPLELQQGRELFSGIPLEGRKADYATNQMPIVNVLARMTNVGPFGPTKRAEEYGYGNKEAILNWLSNANVTGSGPYIKSAEFELLPNQRKQNEEYRKFAKEIGYPLKDKGRIPQWIKDLYEQRQRNEQ